MAKKATTNNKKTTTKGKSTPKKPRSTAAQTETQATSTASVTEDQIRNRAFELYCAGVNPQNPEADWIQAERELLFDGAR